MKIAHICHQCGLELTRVPAVRDPHYNLPLVGCPRCGRQQVRRRHPLVMRWRQTQRLLQATAHGNMALILLLILITFALPLTGMLLEELADSWRILNQEAPNTRALTPELVLEATLIYLWLAATTLTGGAFVAGVLRHWRRRIAWLTWLALLILLASKPLILSGFFELMHAWYPASSRPSAGIDWTRFGQSLLGALLIFSISFLGAPIGWWVVTASAKSKVRRRRKQRRKRRKQQQS